MITQDAELGHKIAEYETNRGRQISNITGFIFLTLIAIGGMALILEDGWYGQAIIFVLLFGLGILYFGVVCFTSLRALWLNRRIEVYENGLKIIDRRKARSWRWEALTDFQSTRMGCWLVADGRKTLLINNTYRTFPMLINMLLEKMSEIKSPVYQAALDSGQTITAGLITVNPDGISIGRQQHITPWDKIRLVWHEGSFQEFKMTTTDTNHTLTASITNVPNAILVVSWLVQKLGQKVAPESPSQKVEPQAEATYGEFEARISPGVQLYKLAVAGIVLVPLLLIVDSLFSDFREQEYLLVLVMGIIELIGGAIGIWLIFSAIKNLWLNGRLVANLEGLRFFTRRQSKHWRWDELGAYRIARTITFQAAYVFYDSSNQKVLTIDSNFRPFGDIGNQVLTHINNHLQPLFEKKFENGERLDFGSVALDKNGLYVKNKQWAWSQIEGWDNETQSSSIIIFGERQKTLVKFNVFALSNPGLLFGFLSRGVALKQKPAEESPGQNMTEG
jgi:hypothetical protein